MNEWRIMFKPTYDPSKIKLDELLLEVNKLSKGFEIAESKNKRTLWKEFKTELENLKKMDISSQNLFYLTWQLAINTYYAAARSHYDKDLVAQFKVIIQKQGTPRGGILADDILNLKKPTLRILFIEDQLKDLELVPGKTPEEVKQIENLGRQFSDLRQKINTCTDPTNFVKLDKNLFDISKELVLLNTKIQPKIDQSNRPAK